MTITPVQHEATRYWVGSQSRPGTVHLVDADYDGAWACSCHDHQCRERECKHIRAVQEFVRRAAEGRVQRAAGPLAGSSN